MAKYYDETGNELTPLQVLGLKVKKEHIFRIVLWIAGVSLTVIWLAFLIASSVSAGAHKILGETIIVKNIEQINNYFKDEKWVITDLVSSPTLTATFKHVDKVVDLNPLCLTYDSSLTGWYLLVVLAPVGYMGCIYIIAVIKNMITPQAVQRTVRKALQFGYLTQADVDYIVNEIDYNTGVKIRPEIKNEEPEQAKEKELN